MDPPRKANIQCYKAMPAYGDRRRLCACPGLGSGVAANGPRASFWGDENMLTLIVVMVECIRIFQEPLSECELEGM